MVKLSKFIWLNYHIERWLILAWIGACAYFLIRIGIDFKEGNNKLATHTALVLNYESLGQGPFSLNPQYLNPHTPKVLDSVFAVIGSKVIFGDNYIHIGLEDSLQLQ
jgi:hypothetical protein